MLSLQNDFISRGLTWRRSQVVERVGQQTGRRWQMRGDRSGVKMSPDRALGRMCWEARRRAGKVERGDFSHSSLVTSSFKLMFKRGKRCVKGEKSQKGMSGGHRSDSPELTSFAPPVLQQIMYHWALTRSSESRTAFYLASLALCLENTWDIE